MSENFDQNPFHAASFTENPEPRCPCILLLDTSYSMRGKPLDELNLGVKAFKDELGADSLAMKRVEVALVGFGPVAVHCDFSTPDQFFPPELEPTGDTPMGAAIDRALDMVKQRKDVYKANGISYYRPWIFMITDGGPTDAYQHVISRIKDGEDRKQFSFFAVGVEGADMERLTEISERAPLKLDGLKFRDLFAWLSSSLGSVSRSQVGDAVPLQAPSGWAQV